MISSVALMIRKKINITQLVSALNIHPMMLVKLLVRTSIALKQKMLLNLVVNVDHQLKQEQPNVHVLLLIWIMLVMRVKSIVIVKNTLIHKNVSVGETHYSVTIVKSTKNKIKPI